MNAININVVLWTAGTLILQLAVISFAQQRIPTTVSASGYSTPPAARAAAESSESQARSVTVDSAKGTVTAGAEKPVGAGEDLYDWPPAL